MEKVKDYRRENPRLGSVKLWLILKRQFEDTGCFPGRDTFIELLHRHGLMVKIKRRRHYVTTDSNHNYRKYPNLIKGMTVTAPNRVWVSDITYVELLKSRKIQISMTQSGDPLENSVAERANGILKTEWLYRMTIPDGNTCKTEMQRIIGFYNNERPHMSVGYQTPSEAHAQSGLQKRCWRNSWEKPPE